jgi:hypothetical protein
MRSSRVEPPLNVVLIVSDQHRLDACGCFGSKVQRRDGSSPTPHIDALAARGVAFERAICSSPLCAPSRASYLTGLHPHSTTALYHKMLDREAGLSRFPGVRAGWEAVEEGARYALWREPQDGRAVLVAAGLEALTFSLPADEGPHRYRIVASAAPVRSFVDPTGRARYGCERVLAKEYPECLPVSPLLVLAEKEETVVAKYQPWHGIAFGGVEWIYEGVPPETGEGKLRGTGPVAILSARPRGGAFSIRLNETKVEGNPAGSPQESSLDLVFAWLSQEWHYGLAIMVDGSLELYRREGPAREILASSRGIAGELQMTVEGVVVDVFDDAGRLLTWSGPDTFPSGRIGFTAGLAVPRFSFGPEISFRPWPG